MAYSFNRSTAIDFLNLFQAFNRQDFLTSCQPGSVKHPGFSLFKLNTVTFKPADHNPTHYTGSKDNRFIKHTELFYAKGNSALELPNRKGILKMMESRKEEVDKFVKVNELNLTVERHIIALFDYYNSLTSTTK